MRYPLASVLLFLAALPGLATANPVPGGGPISAYADPAGTDMCLYDLGEGTLTVYIVQDFYWQDPPTASACAFAAPKPMCLAGTYLGEWSPFPTMGNSQVGITVVYPECRTGDPFLILTIQYQVHGATPYSCLYWVVGDPAEPSGHVVILDCDGMAHTVGDGAGMINGYGFTCDPVGTETSTWGRVKGLYR